MPYKRAVLFVNGELIDPEKVCSLLRDGDYLIAVDGGLRHVKMLKMVPHLLIGDLDSVTGDDLEQIEAAGVAIKRYPIQKDDTDLELGLQYVLKEGYHDILIIAALGGRVDQTLANIFLLSSPRLADCDVRLVDGCEEVLIIREQGVVTGRPGDTVSLLPHMGVAGGVTTDGLLYPLRDETLYPDRTRGISNVMLSERASIGVRKGMLICIHTHVS